MSIATGSLSLPLALLGRPGGASRHGSCFWECGLHREQGPGSPRSSPGLRARLQRCRPQGARGAEPGPFQPPGTQAPRGTPMRGRRLHRGARSPLRAHGSWPRGHASEASRRPNPRWPQPVPGLGARAGGRQRPTVGGRGARGLGPSRVGRGRPVPASPRQLSPGVASRADLGLGAPLPGAGFPARKHRGPRAPAFLGVTQSSGGRVRDKTDNLPTVTCRGHRDSRDLHALRTFSSSVANIVGANTEACVPDSTHSLICNTGELKTC